LVDQVKRRITANGYSPYTRQAYLAGCAEARLNG